MPLHVIYYLCSNLAVSIGQLLQKIVISLNISVGNADPPLFVSEGLFSVSSFTCLSEDLLNNARAFVLNSNFCCFFYGCSHCLNYIPFP